MADSKSKTKFPLRDFIAGTRWLSVDGVMVIAVLEHINGKYFVAEHQASSPEAFDEEFSKRISEQRAYLKLEEFHSALNFQRRLDAEFLAAETEALKETKQ